MHSSGRLTAVQCSFIASLLCMRRIDHANAVSRPARRLAANTAIARCIPYERMAQVKAECRDGILALYLPRAERDKPKSIAIT